MEETYNIGSCRQVSKMSGIWRLCIGYSRVIVVQVQVVV